MSTNTAPFDLVDTGLILEVANQRGRGGGSSKSERFVSMRQRKPGVKRNTQTASPKPKAP